MSELVLDPSLDPAQDQRHLHRHPPVGSVPSFRLELDNGLASLVFDSPGSAVNVLNEATLCELDDHLEEIEFDSSIKALIIRSAKDKVFVAGADLKAIRSLPPARVESLVRLGQEVFSRLASLPIPKIAAIHGACVGGGLELTLACDYRIATNDDATRLGLPEVQLGLIPGWGGCTRLPRLLGLPKALDLILSGRLVKASQALKLGLVDQVVQHEHLDVAARSAVQQFKSKHTRFDVTRVWPVRSLILGKAEHAMRAKTRGLYEAPIQALTVIRRGVSRSMDQSLAMEREALTSLASSSATAHLIDLFFAKEAASKKPWPVGHVLPMSDVAVVGAGVMGAGIAHWLAGRGVRVTLMDISTEALGKGMKRIRDLAAEAVSRRLITRKEARDTLDHIQPTHERVPLQRCQMVIEAATEDLALKKRIFADLATRCGADTILATNTSALSVAALAVGVPHPDLVIGLHFFNPVHRMPLVEIITLPGTNIDVLASVHGFVQHTGKVPVVVKDSPGFVVNRILMPYLMDAVQLVEAGHDPRVIDGAMLEFGMPMGPIRLLDEIGLDVALHVAKTLGSGSALIERLVASGDVGKKSGRGFYIYTKGRADLLATGRSVTGALLEPDEIQERLTQRMSDEAMAVLAEGVAGSAKDIDLAMVLGAGYAPFRGGPLAYINIG